MNIDLEVMTHNESNEFMKTKMVELLDIEEEVLGDEFDFD